MKGCNRCRNAKGTRHYFSSSFPAFYITLSNEFLHLICVLPFILEGIIFKTFDVHLRFYIHTVKIVEYFTVHAELEMLKFGGDKGSSVFQLLNDPYVYTKVIFDLFQELQPFILIQYTTIYSNAISLFIAYIPIPVCADLSQVRISYSCFNQ